MGSGKLLVVAVVLVCTIVGISAQVIGAKCEKRSCYPATGDLLLGREDTLYASSTCGLSGPEKYCIVSHLKDQEECFICDSQDQSPSALSHLPKNMLSSFNGQIQRTWWQSENGKENVFIQLDLEAEFHFTHLIMTFRSFRPAGMLIERSWDYGRKWQVYQYFAENCAKTYPHIPKGPATEIDEVICTEDYSSVEPSTEGEVIFRALNPLIPIKDPYSLKVQNLLKLTNIRINMTKLHNLGDTVLDPTRSEIREKYYYAVYDLVIRGSCSCFGHAEQCLPLPNQPNIPGMVHGQCNCTHNTEGKNCERCKTNYNDRPWKPATANNTNECRKCECNGHATECRFDAAVYELSGNVSGGVCLNCQHNTVGRKCDQCKPLHYHDPRKPFSDPGACLPCNCDPTGGVSGGECEAKHDPAKGLYAGTCICKKYVNGPRCDTCLNGYWNMRESNPEGCEACGCHPDGIIGKCNPQSGECTCKRSVTGKFCDRCLPGYWGLGKSPSGCHQCECDPGGSYEKNCEQIKGQCRCRKGITGRRCDRVKTGNYFPLPDHLIYEAETARGIGKSSEEPREPPKDSIVSWTGDGFRDVQHGTALEYAVTNVPYTGQYNVLVRYSAKDAGVWRAVVTVSRTDGKPLSSGQCANASSNLGDGNFTAVLSPYKRYSLLDQGICMEKGVSYYVKVTYLRDESNQDGMDSLLPDSTALLPSTGSGLFEGPDGEKLRQQYQAYGCQDYHLAAASPRPQLSGVCRRLIFSQSSVLYDGAVACNCDPAGTERDENSTLICDPSGGQCKCKANVMGQRCDRCAPGSYDFGPNGCKPCECDSIGSSDNFCNQQTGQCSCAILASGRQCNLCPPRQWGFPVCRPCKCNSHASSCNPKTGVCIDCEHNTAGDNCEKCSQGYYGDATSGSPTGCKRCQCPGGSSENQFSKTCYLDKESRPSAVVCDACEEGYSGRQCEKCADGYYGNPLVPGGRCQKCFCNMNVDPGATGNCDRVTGECRKCLYNTAGFTCNRCKSGFFGSALAKNCTECTCDPLGTSPGFLDTCNDVTGQCKCQPHVVGAQCDKCAVGYWNLASGKGCEKCQCCEDGALRNSCDPVDGRCKCKAGYGGATCCECDEFFWGSPASSCQPCDCNAAGSVSLQCNRTTGQCHCKPGMVGGKCDQCALDTSGSMPHCQVCGECYYQWKDTLEYLSLNVSREIQGIGNVSVSGPTNVYTYEKEIQELKEKLKKIEIITENQVTSEKDTDAIKDELDSTADIIQDLQDRVLSIEKELETIEVQSKEADAEVEELRERLAKLLRDGEHLKSEIERIRSKDIRRAFEDIQNSHNTSQRAGEVVEDAEALTAKSRETREEIDRLLDGPPAFDVQANASMTSLDDIQKRIAILINQLDLLNRIVCGADQSECGACGVSDCSACGGPGCNGSIDLARRALARAKEAERAQREREAAANATLEEMRNAEVMVNMTRQAAARALLKAEEANEQALNASSRMDQLIQDILDFLARKYPDPKKIEDLAERVKNLSLSVTPEEIKKLSADIEDALATLTGIDEIIENTARNLTEARNLQKEAEEARRRAQTLPAVIQSVADALTRASEGQRMASEAIAEAQQDIDMAGDVLDQMYPEVDELQQRIRTASEDIDQMLVQTPSVLADLQDNRKEMATTETLVQQATDASQAAKNESETLREAFDAANFNIERKTAMVKNGTARLDAFKGKANTLRIRLENYLRKIIEIENEKITYDALVEEVKKEQERMRTLVQRIRGCYAQYRGCNPIDEFNC